MRSTRPLALAVSLFVAGLGSNAYGQAPADIATRLPASFQYDAARSADGMVLAGLMSSVYTGMAPDAQVRTWVYRHPGTLKEALAAIRLPETARVREQDPADAGGVAGMTLSMLEKAARARLGDAWFEQASKRVAGWSGQTLTTFGIDLDVAAIDTLRPGQKARIVTLGGFSPLMDMKTFELVPGTWLQVIEVSFTVPAAGEGEGDEAGAGAPDAGTLGVPPPAGGIWLDPNDVPPGDELNGDHNYLVKAPFRQIVDAYVKSTARHCRVTDESSIADGDGERPIIGIDCLTHAGERKTGDDVVVIEVTPATKNLLEDAAPSTQGVWTLVRFYRYREE